MVLPRGAVCTFLTLAFTGVAVIAVLSEEGLVDIGDGDKKWILAELSATITFYFASKALGSAWDTRAKVKAIEKAESAEQALGIYRYDQWSNRYLKKGHEMSGFERGFACRVTAVEPGR